MLTHTEPTTLVQYIATLRQHAANRWMQWNRPTAVEKTAKPLKNAARLKKRTSRVRKQAVPQDTAMNVDVMPQGPAQVLAVKMDGSLDDVTLLQPGEGVLIARQRWLKSGRFTSYSSVQSCAHQRARYRGFDVQVLRVCRGSLLVLRVLDPATLGFTKPQRM